MEYRLFGNGAGGGDEVHPVGGEDGVECSADVKACRCKVCRRSLVGVPEVGDVGPRNDQGVAPRRGLQGEERHPIVALANDLRLCVGPVDDTAERAVTWWL